MDLFDDLPEPTSTPTFPNNSSSSQQLENSLEVSISSTKTIAATSIESNISSQDGRHDGQMFIDEISGNKKLKRSISSTSNDDEDVLKRKKFAKDVYSFRGYYAERKGEREEMQDAHTIVDNFNSLVDSQSKLSLFAVFDGHGGCNASKYSASHLHKIIAQKFPTSEENFEKDIRKCFVESFKKLDDDFLQEARRKRPSWKDGTTAVVVVAVDSVLYIGNIGDSKAVVCRYDSTLKKMVALPLTTDHSPTLYEERMRIQKAGGHVRDGRVMGILEVSRSIGDGPFKQHGVTCLPDVKRCSLTPQDRFILIACDGLWKRFEDDSAIEFINKILNDDKIEGTDMKDVDCIKMELAANRLANEAVRRLSADNVTILLVDIKHNNNNNNSKQKQHNNNNDSNDNDDKLNEKSDVNKSTL
ncbi:hypothetical protein HELRODRAFT_116079 [Helobdella robusta]|uniref:Integrin-linked kinase-associated serine/threonine phosphatase 2C n=1 Tax=Helobdella robusta TaxID=6412 RepID=T1EGC8_HELRO|nr:hypothetical protein HELRODRAFT_116079 [Helobdella robusta]ESN92230.1 hypothetical protein HELRODRAFT_116079 [Helobdella robusta]